MGFFSRSLRLVSANLHDRLDQLEQPEQLARHGLRELDRALRDATAAAARSIAAERVLQQRCDVRQREIAALDARAADAVRAGHDPEAQRLLGLKFARLQALGQVDRQLLDARQVNERLRAHVRRMQECRRDEQSRLELFIARRATATAAHSLAASQSTYGESAAPFDDLRQSLERLEQATLVAEAEAELRAPAELDAPSVQATERDAFIVAEMARLRATNA